jgi:hypothetical protein
MSTGDRPGELPALSTAFDVASLSDADLDQVTRKSRRFLTLQISACSLVVIGVIGLGFSGVGAFEYFAGVATLATVLVFLGYCWGEMRVIRYERWRRDQSAPPPVVAPVAGRPAV